MIEACVRSARRVGVSEDFHVWTSDPISGATCHPLGHLDKSLYIFKLHYLREEVRKLGYEYYIWIDADTYFVRHPGDALRFMNHSPVHGSLEADASSPKCTRPDWWGVPLQTYVKLMRERGVRSRAVFNLNGGFWIVHRDVIETFCDLSLEFWQYCRHSGYSVTEEPAVAYAVQMLCGNPYSHTLRATSDLWASDWTGYYHDVLPDGRSWVFRDYFTNERFVVNPAIIHAMRSKTALMNEIGVSRER